MVGFGCTLVHPGLTESRLPNNQRVCHTMCRKNTSNNQPFLASQHLQASSMDTMSYFPFSCVKISLHVCSPVLPFFVSFCVLAHTPVSSNNFLSLAAACSSWKLLLYHLGLSRYFCTPVSCNNLQQFAGNCTSWLLQSLSSRPLHLFDLEYFAHPVEIQLWSSYLEYFAFHL